MSVKELAAKFSSGTPAQSPLEFEMYLKNMNQRQDAIQIARAKAARFNMSFRAKIATGGTSQCKHSAKSHSRRVTKSIRVVSARRSNRNSNPAPIPSDLHHYAQDPIYTTATIPEEGLEESHVPRKKRSSSSSLSLRGLRSSLPGTTARKLKEKSATPKRALVVCEGGQLETNLPDDDSPVDIDRKILESYIDECHPEMRSPPPSVRSLSLSSMSSASSMLSWSRALSWGNNSKGSSSKRRHMSSKRGMARSGRLPSGFKDAVPRAMMHSLALDETGALQVLREQIQAYDNGNLVIEETPLSSAPGEKHRSSTKAKKKKKKSTTKKQSSVEVPAVAPPSTKSRRKSTKSKSAERRSSENQVAGGDEGSSKRRSSRKSTKPRIKSSRGSGGVSKQDSAAPKQGDTPKQTTTTRSSAGKKGATTKKKTKKTSSTKGNGEIDEAMMELLHSFFEIYDPAKMCEVTEMVSQYKGREEVLFDLLESEYQVKFNKDGYAEIDEIAALHKQLKDELVDFLVENDMERYKRSAAEDGMGGNVLLFISTHVNYLMSKYSLSNLGNALGTLYAQPLPQMWQEELNRHDAVAASLEV